MSGGINDGLGNMYNYNGPMLWTVSLFHDNEVAADSIMDEVDSQIERLRENPVSQAELDRALVKLRSSFYDYLDYYNGMGRADLLASFALFDDDPGLINRIEDGFRAITPKLLQKTARTYLDRSQRTVLELEPGQRAE